MNIKSALACSLSGFALVCSVPASAQDAADASESSGAQNEDAIIVTGARDLIGVMQKESTDSVFGFDKSLVETPRSVTDISDELLSRYNIKSVYDFTAVAAGTTTGSFFGVPGSINIRGTVADNYYNGFQGITNYANFPTPVDASSNIEIVRGPPSPLYGAGQVGGYLNFIPKSGHGDDTRYISDFEGMATVTVGSYDQREATLDLSMPVTIGSMPGGLHLFGKLEDSDSFYRGMHPESQLGQVGYSADITPSIALTASYQYVHSDGYLKNIGWNRLTQQLVDDQLYISGQPLTQIVADGADFITTEQFYAVTGGSTLMYYAPEFGLGVYPNEYTMLDPDTVDLVKLSPRTTFLDPGVDINEATAHTGYIGLEKTFEDDATLKFESFINTLDSRNYQSYGFATVFDAIVTEQRMSYARRDDLGALELQSIIGVSYRHSKSHDLGSLNAFALSEDRRDLTVGPTPDDRFNNPFAIDGYVWPTSVHSTIDNFAAFGLFDATVGPVSLTLGGRVDNYDIDAYNDGLDTGGSTDVSTASATPFSYNASLAYSFPWATFYGTYAKSQSLQLSQGGALNPTLITNGSFVGKSKLKEIGVKTSQFGGRLFVSLDAYEQERTYLSSPPTGTVTTSGIKGRGIEAELRWLATRRLGVTATATVQESKVMPTAGSGAFLTYPGALTGVDPTLVYGGYTFANMNYLDSDFANGYEIYTTPGFSGGLFVTYDADGAWGLTGGATYNTEVSGYIPGSITLPDYLLAKAGAYVTFGDLRLDFNVDNVFDKLYFIPNNVTDTNANVLPGVGRTFHLKASFAF